MGREKEIAGIEKNTTMFVIVLILASLFPLVLYAQTNQSVTLSAPTNASQTSGYGMRTHPVTGQASTPHRGLDYGVSCGTTFQARDGGNLRCTTMNGYGGVGEVSRACGVVERYAHLQSCNTSSGMTSGGARGMAGAGTSTGCHLHYEIIINGTTVDPSSAFGKDLCDESVRRQLIQEAQQKLQGRAGGGGGASSGSNAQQPPASNSNDDVQSVTFVGNGETDPRTGVVNNGPGYYIVTTRDGRTTQQMDAGAEGTTMTVLPPTTSNVVPAGGGGGETTGCATDTWTAMVNQAVLQTRREVVMNGRYIAKPDSVLGYSCFYDAIDKARMNLGVFSESQLWVNRQINILDGNIVQMNVELGQYSLDGALTNAALEPYESFLRAYFSHEHLGGMLGNHNHATGATHEHSSPQAYAGCDQMAQVWNEAKCMNVTDDPLFYKFSDLIGNDPRKYPENYQCFDTGITQGMIDIAQNKSAQFSQVKSYVNILYPGSGSCAQPIPTGVTVHRQEGASQITNQITYPDGVCITAGCSYQNGGGGAGTCEIKGP